MASVAAEDPQSHTGTLQKLRNTFHKFSDKKEPELQGCQNKRLLSHRRVEDFLNTQHSNDAYNPNISLDARVQQWLDKTEPETPTSVS